MILYLNAEVGGLSMPLKIKKIKIKTTKANRKQQNISIIAKLGFEPRSLARIITTGVLYHMARLQIYKMFVQISVHRMGDKQ